MALHPYLCFNGNCREAMLFYQACFGGQLDLSLLCDTHEGRELPASMQHLVVEAVLTSRMISIVGSDLALDKTLVNGNRIALLLQAESADQLTGYCRCLAPAHMNGVVLQPGECTNFTDPFGVNWIMYY